MPRERSSPGARPGRATTRGATARYVVLLRGVNVGKAKRVPMAEFRAVLLGVGCTSATTVLNSGNAVVDAPEQPAAALAERIAAALVAKFGFGVPVVVVPADDLARIVADADLAGEVADPSRLLVAFGQTPNALERARAVVPLAAPPDRMVVGRRAAYLHCARGVLESKAAKALLGKAGEGLTTRNWATVRKLHAIAADGAGG